MDGHDLEAGVEQRVDEQPRGAFEGNAEGTTPAEAAQAGEKVREAIGGVGGRAPPTAAAGLDGGYGRMGPTPPRDPLPRSPFIPARDCEGPHPATVCPSRPHLR